MILDKRYSFNGFSQHIEFKSAQIYQLLLPGYNSPQPHKVYTIHATKTNGLQYTTFFEKIGAIPEQFPGLIH